MMFSTFSRRRGGLARPLVSLTAILALAAAPLRADVLIWDASSTVDNAQDGAGTWTSTGGNWFNSTQSLQNQAWVNGSSAVFGAGSGAAGTVTLSGPISAAALTFDSAGSGTYTLGGSGTLTLSNATLTANASAAISAVLAGNTPWTKTGAGTLTLNGSATNTHTGTLSVSQGTLTLAKSGGATAVAGNLDITNGAFVTFSGTTTNQIAATSAVTMSGEASVFNGTGPNAGTGNSLNQTLASLTITGGTFNAGAVSTWNITGAFSMTGGAAGSQSVFVGNSASVFNVGSLSLVNMNGISSSGAVTNGFTVFGNGGSNGTTRMTVGSGGVYLQNSIIYLGSGSTGSLLYLNGDVSTGGTAASSIQTTGTGTAPAVGLGTTGTVSRAFNIASGADLTISVPVTNGTAAGAALVKTGAGMLTLSGGGGNTYTGDTTIDAGTLRLNKTAGITAVAGDIIVNTGGTLQLSASHQIDDAKGITLNGGALAAFTTDETLAFFTQNSGGLASSGNTGHMTITGALTLAGGATLTINSNTSANPASWSAGSLVMTGADILIGGSNGTGNPRTSLTIGSGGLTMAGRTISLNGGSAGVVVNLNGDFTGTGSNTIALGTGGPVMPLLEIGSAARTFNLLSGTTTIAVEISGAGGSLVKTGPGLLQLTGTSSYTGATIVSGGTLSVSGAGGMLNGTASLVVNGGAILQNGSSVNANNNGITNRINPAATLTLDGGTFTQIAAAAASSTTQSLASLAITGGASTVSATAVDTSTNTLTFSGASPYTRAGGVVNFVQTPASGSSIVFTNAPSGAGNVNGGALAGATLNGADLVAAQSGTLTAFSGWVPTGTSTWTAGAAMDVTGTNAVAYAGANITALRFNTPGPFTVTLSGTHTVDTSIVLMTAAAGAGSSLITGGTLQGAAGGGLVLAQYNTSGTLEIASTLADNGAASDLVKSGPGLVVLSGSNTYTGITRVGEGVLRATDGTGLPAASALQLAGGVFEPADAAFTRTLGTGAGQVSLGGASAGFNAAGSGLTVNVGGAGTTLQWGGPGFDTGALVLNAATASAALELVNGLDLNGQSRTVRVDAAAAYAATISGLISNSAAGAPAQLVKTGAGTLRLTQDNTYDGGTLVAGGLIALGSSQALGAGTVTLSGGGLQADGAARTLGNNVVITGSATVVSALNLTLGGTVTNSGGNQTLNTTLTGGAVLELAGNVYLSESAALSRYLQILGSGDRVISGVIANNAGDNALASNLFFNGSGTLTLSGVNTYSGRTLSAGGGYIVLSQDRNLGAVPVAPMTDALILASNGRIRAAASFTLDANRGIGIGNSGGGTAIGQIDVVSNATLTVAGVIADRTLNQDGTAVTAANTGGLTKTGTGALVLSGSNTYSGVTTVSNGVLQIASNGALGSTAGGTAITSNGHILLADGVKITGETLTMGNTSNVNGTAQIGAPTAGRGTLTVAPNAKAEWAGDILLGADLSRVGVQEGGTLILSGNISDGASSFTLRISGELTGAGGVILSGTGNAWDGGTDVVRGKLILGAHNTLPTATTLDIHMSASNNSEYAGVDMNGFNQTVGILRNTGSTGANAELTNSSRTLSTFTLNDTGTNTYGGIITGNLALVKNGAGMLILAQANRLTGGITVNAGILRAGNSSALAEGNVTVNGGASSAGRLDLNNLSVGVNALNGSSGAVAAVIANESATNAIRTLTLGVNHGSGSYAGQILDNSGGAAAGKVAVAKIGSGTQTLSGAGAYTGSTLVTNGVLAADYSSAAPLGSSAISLQGGTLAVQHASGVTLGNITLVQGGADFSAGNVLRIENGGSVTTPLLTASSFAPLLVDLSSGSSFAATALSGAAVTNDVLMGASGRASIFVQDSTGLGFAAYNSTTGQITRYTGATALPSGGASTSTSANYVVSADLTRTSTLSFQTLQIDTSGSSVALNLGSSNISVGSGRMVLVTGTHDASISSTGAAVSGSIFFANHSTGTLTVGISLNAQALVSIGPGVVDYTSSGILADVYAAGGVLRISGADRDFSTGVLRIYGGGVLELGADLNGAGTAGALTRAVGQVTGQVALIGNGGFSAHGADRVVALGGVGTATALTWGASNFLSGPGTTDGSYTFMLGSATSTHTLEFQNAIALGSRDRRIEVADGTSSTNTDARLTGVLSGAGSVIKEGAGRLEFTAANSYSGTTQVNAGSLVVASGGRTGTGAVSVAAGAALMGSGMVQGSSFTLAANAALHAGGSTTAASLGTLAFQTTAKASFDLQSGSLITLDIATATNQAAVDASFGGNAIGSAGYNAFVDAFSGTGSGSHDLITFDGAAGSTLAFSSSLAVRGDALNAAMGQVFNLVDWSSLVSADFAGFNTGANFRTGADDNGLQFDLPELAGGLFWDVSRFTTSGVIVVVPEPARALLVLLGLAGMKWRRRRC